MPVNLEERKGVLKKIFYALRQSPMFSHYSVEHIRDSAIKSEQLTFERSQTRQEYMHAMHAKLQKIENSYVIGGDAAMREAGKPPYIHSMHKIQKPSPGSMPRAHKEAEEEMNEQAPVYSAGHNNSVRRVNGFENRRGPFNTFNVMHPISPLQINQEPQDKNGFNPYQAQRMYGSLDARDARIVIPSERMGKEHSSAHIMDRMQKNIENPGVNTNPLNTNPGTRNMYIDDTRAGKEKMYMEGNMEDIKKMQTGGIEELSRIGGINGGIVGRDKKIFGIGGMNGMGLVMGGIGSGMHRIGAAGSTNTVTKMNSSKSYLSRSPKYVEEETRTKRHNTPPPDEKSKVVEKKTAQKASERKADIEEKTKKEREEQKKQINQLQKEIEQMKIVVETHKELFPEKESKRKIMHELEDVFAEQVNNEDSISIESVYGTVHQMKKQAIVLTSEIRQKKENSFRKTMERISSAFSRRKSIDPEYFFRGITYEHSAANGTLK